MDSYFRKIFEMLCERYGEPLAGAVVNDREIRAGWPGFHFELTAPVVVDPEICM